MSCPSLEMRHDRIHGGGCMKYLHIERFHVDLTVLSPVFIGGGQALDINKKNSVRFGAKYLLIPRENQLIEELDKMGFLDEYESFLMNPNILSLGDFLANRDVEVDDKAPWVAYALECTEERIQTLKPFIKTLDGKPYIPGSSVKGAMRTAYLSFLMKNRDMESLINSVSEKANNRYSGKEENPLRILNINQKRFEDPVNDLLKGLAVSDSSPIETNALFVGRKRDYKIDAPSTDDGKMPLLRECLRPGTKTEFTVSLDTTIFPLSRLDELKKALAQWQNTLYKRYDSQFEGINTIIRMPSENAVPIILGAGGGFQTKSLLYACTDQDTVRRLVHKTLGFQFRKTYKAGPGSPLPAPYCFKIVMYNGVAFPYGRCAMEFE